MSKAFTSEETEDKGPLVRAAPTASAAEPRYITPEGFAALKAQADGLRQDASALAASPDAAARLALLEATLATVTLLGPDAAPEGRAAFGVWVTVEDEDGHTRTYRLVGPDEADARRGLVSVNAPVGRALLGKEEGDTVEVTLPGPRGQVALTVIGVSRCAPQDAAGCQE